MKFYVYLSTDKDPVVDFIEDESIERFAQAFNPAQWVFSGIAIEAEDIDIAHKVWHNPTCTEGQYMMSDEPVQTAIRKSSMSVTALTKQLAVIQAALRMKIVAMKLHQVNETMNEAAEQIYKAYGSPSHSSAKKVFEELSKYVIGASIKYNGNTEESR